MKGKVCKYPKHARTALDAPTAVDEHGLSMATVEPATKQHVQTPEQALVDSLVEEPYVPAGQLVGPAEPSGQYDPIGLQSR